MKSLINYLEKMNDIFYCCDINPQFKYHFLTPSINKYFGKYTKKAHLQNPELIFDMVHPDDRHLLEAKKKGYLDFSKPIFYRFLNENGEYTLFEDVSTPIYENGQLKGVIGVFRVATENMDTICQLEQKLRMDGMTSTYNREYFKETMDILNNVRDIPVGLAVVDLDNLKQINDQNGHQAGDDYIMDAANLLKKFATNQIFVVRYGGDEFVVLFLNANIDMIENYFNQVLAEKAILNKTRKVALNFSIGYAYSESSVGKMNELFAEADQQMYVTKFKKNSEVVVV